jgi:hypothetical protein
MTSLCFRSTFCCPRSLGYCDVPIRFFFAFGSLLVSGLLALAGCSALMRIVYGLAVPAWSDPRFDGFEGTLTFIACFAAILVVECVTESVDCVIVLITHLSFSAWAREKRSPGAAISRRIIASAVQAGEMTVAYTVICGVVIAVLYALLFPKAHMDAGDPNSAERGLGAWGESTLRALLQFSIIFVVALLMAVLVLGQIVRAFVPFFRRAQYSALLGNVRHIKNGLPAVISALRSPSSWIPLGRLVIFIIGSPFVLIGLVPLHSMSVWLSKHLPSGHPTTNFISSFTAACENVYTTFWVWDWSDGQIVPDSNGHFNIWLASSLVALGPGESSWSNFLIALSSFSGWYNLVWVVGGLVLACEGQPTCPALLGLKSDRGKVVIQPGNTCRTSSKTVSDTGAQLGPAVFGVMILAALSVASMISTAWTDYSPRLRAWIQQGIQKKTLSSGMQPDPNSNAETTFPSDNKDNTSATQVTLQEIGDRRRRIAAISAGSPARDNSAIDDDESFGPEMVRTEPNKLWHPSPLHAATGDGSTSDDIHSSARRLDHARSLRHDATLPCAVGSTLLGLSLLAAFVALCAAASPKGPPISVGLALTGMCIFLAGSMFQRRPSKGAILPTIVRGVLSIVACVYAVFNASLTTDTSGEENGKVIISAAGTWNDLAEEPGSPGAGAPAPESYDVCSIDKAGNSVLDYCVLATQAYYSTTSSAAQVGSWMSAANRSVISLTACLPQFPPDLMASYQRTGVYTKLTDLPSWDCPGKLDVGLRYDAYFEPSGTLSPKVIAALSNGTSSSSGTIRGRNTSDAPALCSVDWREIELLRGTPGRLFIVFRGTSSPSDVASDVLTWQEAAFMEVLSSIGPYSMWPERVKQVLLFASSIVGSTFSLQGSSFYYQWAPLIPHVYTRLLLPQAADNPDGWLLSEGLDIVVTGHSLGGGLSSWAGEYNFLESVSFSGPGIALTSPKMRLAVEGGLSTIRGTKAALTPPYGGPLFRTLEYEQALVIIPDLDVVPRIDEHLGTVQNIKCMNGVGTFARTAVGCHGILRTCCELRRSCGDRYNRTLADCAQWQPPSEI